MLRARLANFTVAAGLGLTAGCSSLSGHSLFSHFGHHSKPESECVVGADSYPIMDGPVLQDYGPYPMSPGQGQPQAPTYPGPGPGMAPQPLTNPPQLQPQPQAPPEPYRGTKNSH